MLHHMSDRFGDLLVKRIIANRARRYRAGIPRLAAVPSEHLGLAIASHGLYERAEIAFVESLATRLGLSGTVMLDIGANIGNHACALAGSFGEIWAFEPNPPVAALLRANLLLNDIANVQVHAFGLGAEDAELPFGVSEHGNDGTGSFARGGSSKTLPVRAGDAALAGIAAACAGERRIGFIKCDVEGFEASVFAGLQATLASHRPVVMFESGSARLGGEAWAELRKAGYGRLERLVHPGDGATNRFAREAARLMRGDACSTVKVEAPPEAECNLLAFRD